jgi:glycosyltransferase involved in cell wall biosynthesis
MPDVSVVIPTRDRAGLLAQTLATVLWQRDVSFEVVVVDDGSEMPMVGRVSELSDPRVVVVRNETSLGVSGARNTGIERATGAWVAFCDDDDLWAPDKLADQIAAATSAGCSWVYAGDVNIDDRLRIIGGGPPPPPETVMADLVRYNAVPSGASNVVVRADVLGEVGVFDEDLKRVEDWDLWLRLARTGPPSWVPRPLVGYRFHPGNAPAETASFVTEPRLLADRHGLVFDLAVAHRRAAWACLRGGRRRAALRHYLQAARAGDLSSLGRIALTLLHPAAGSERVFGLLRGGNSRGTLDAWNSEADGWLDLVRVAGNIEPRKTQD